MKNRSDREDGFVRKSKRQTCERLERTAETTGANRINNFHVLKLTASESDVGEVNAVGGARDRGDHCRFWRCQKVSGVGGVGSSKRWSNAC